MPFERDRFDPLPMLAALSSGDVDYVVIGGLAGGAHGSVHVTWDLDIAYARDRQNLERLATTLRQLGARLRGAPADVPFQLDAKTLENGNHFADEQRVAEHDLTEEELADELADGSLDPDEAPADLEPWDEGADDETD